MSDVTISSKFSRRLNPIPTRANLTLITWPNLEMISIERLCWNFLLVLQWSLPKCFKFCFEAFTGWKGAWAIRRGRSHLGSSPALLLQPEQRLLDHLSVRTQDQQIQSWRWRVATKRSDEKIKLRKGRKKKKKKKKKRRLQWYMDFYILWRTVTHPKSGLVLSYN